MQLKKFIRRTSALCMIILLVFSCTGCMSTFISDEPSGYDNKDSLFWQVSYPESETDSNTVNDTKVAVHFIDVGQADSILIVSDNTTMLIDAGTNDAGTTVVNYLKELDITALDWVIGTHPHEDHIGGLDDVILAFDVKHVMLPRKEHTTKTLEDVLDAILQKNLTITAPTVGDTYSLGNCEFVILGPVKDYGDEINNWSVTLKLTCGQTSFIFSGDAEGAAELDMCNTGISLDADIMKLGHHGSVTSSSKEFISAISPDVIVISVGENNDYGHPHDEVMELIRKLDVEIYRTDLHGNIVFESDGITTTVSTQKDLSQYEDIIVHITYAGRRYHVAGCDSLAKSDYEVSLAEAKLKGYKPCKGCQPPQ